MRGLNSHRCQDIRQHGQVQWSRFEGTASFSLGWQAQGWHAQSQLEDSRVLVSLTSNVTFGHRSVATYRGPIYQCQQKHTPAYTHFHLLSAVTMVSHLSNGLHYKKKRQICPQVHCPADFCPLAKALPPFLLDYSSLQPGQDHSSLPALSPLNQCSVICETAFLKEAEDGANNRSYISNRCMEEVWDTHICFGLCHNVFVFLLFVVFTVNV